MKLRKTFLPMLLCLSLVFTLFGTVFATDKPVLVTDTLPEGKVGRNYNGYITISSTESIFSHSIVKSETDDTNASLPDGLSGKYESGKSRYSIYGVPTKPGTYRFALQIVTYGDAQTAVKNYTIVVNAADPLEISTEEKLENATAGESYTQYVETNSSLAKWSIKEDSTLPGGLTLSESGCLSGTPTQDGTFTFTLVATALEQTAEKAFTLTVFEEGGCRHGNRTTIPGTLATCKNNGIKDYYHCNICECDVDEKGYVIRDKADIATYSNHCDQDLNGKCDFCGKNMPVFKKVTAEKEMVCGSCYILVTEIGGKYYALQIPPEGEYGRAYGDAMQLCEITQDENGNFPFNMLVSSGALMVDTEFAADGSPIDAGKPRYGINSILGNALYELSDDGTNIWMDKKYPGSPVKYGYRIALDASGAALFGSVNAEWWSNSESENSGLLNAFDMNYEGTNKKFMTFKSKTQYSGAEITACPIYLYKMTDIARTTKGITFTFNDVNSNVDNGSFIHSEDGKLSYVEGISGAVDEVVVAELIDSEIAAGQTNVAAQFYANIQATAAEDGAVTYSVTPQLDVFAAYGSRLLRHEISDSFLNGAPITVTLHTGGIYPAQIIHYKENGTKEYFYSKWSEEAANGAKSFDYENDFVTITVNSFSSVKILETAEAEQITVNPIGIDASKCSVSGKNVTVTYDKPCKIGYLDGGIYKAVPATKIENGKYSFTLPDGVENAILVVKGDANGDGTVNSADSTIVDRAILPLLHTLQKAITKEAAFAADANGDGTLNSADSTIIDRSILPMMHLAYKPMDW